MWDSLVFSLIANWPAYGGPHAPLHDLGLEPSRECCDLIDDLRLYATIQRRFRPGRRVFQDSLQTFFDFVIRDPKPSVRTNPLLWWLVVLVHCDVHENKPLVSPTAESENMDLHDMIEALDHYAPALVFHNTFLEWIKPPRDQLAADLRSWRVEVPEYVEAVDISSVDRDEEAPPSDTDRSPNLDSPAWTDFRRALDSAVDIWLVTSAQGHMREIVSLQNGILPLGRTSSLPLSADGQETAVFRVGRLTSKYPGRLKKRYDSFEEAYSAAQRTLSRVFRDEAETEEEECSVDDLEEMFPVGNDSHRVVRFNFVVDKADETMRARIVWIDEEAYNFKVTVWIEKEVEP